MATTQDESPSSAWPGRPYALRLTPSGAFPLPDETLCALCHGAHGEGVGMQADPRRVWVPLAVVSGPGCELWLSTGPVRHGWRDAVGWATNGSVALVQLRIPEDELDRDLEVAIAAAYRRLQATASACGCPEPLRMWNYLSAINSGQGERERYRRFCAGRYPVLAAMKRAGRPFPAATAIGTRPGDGLVLFALYGRRAGIQIENPRQVSAFRYPPRYGRRSPSFSRAMLLPWRNGARLMISGTSSIVGHTSVHPDDPCAQFACSMDNIAVLRDTAPRLWTSGPGWSGFELESATVYVRDAAYLAMLRPAFLKYFGRVVPRVLQGDVCRRELLVEVEALYRARS